MPIRSASKSSLASIRRRRAEKSMLRIKIEMTEMLGLRMET